MGFFDRLANVWRGFLSLWVSDIENRNPEAVYESAIDERVRKHRELKKAVSGIVYLRNKLSTELESKERALKDVMNQLPIAIEDGEDEVALVLIQKKDELTASIESLSAEMKKISEQAEEAKSGLLAFQGDIEKLKREKDQMLAAKANAEARIQIQETLDGLSTRPMSRHSTMSASTSRSSRPKPTSAPRSRAIASRPSGRRSRTRPQTPRHAPSLQR
jgi:phage shock protein A